MTSTICRVNYRFLSVSRDETKYRRNKRTLERIQTSCRHDARNITALNRCVIDVSYLIDLYWLIFKPLPSPSLSASLSLKKIIVNTETARRISRKNLRFWLRLHFFFIAFSWTLSSEWLLEIINETTAVFKSKQTAYVTRRVSAFIHVLRSVEKSSSPPPPLHSSSSRTPPDPA